MYKCIKQFDSVKPGSFWVVDRYIVNSDGERKWVILANDEKWLQLSMPIFEKHFVQAKTPMTNEDWFCSLPTKEKADLLSELVWLVHPSVQGGRKVELTKESFLQWLQEEHHEEH